MTENSLQKADGGLIWRIPAVALAYYLGVLIAGAAINAIGMPWPIPPEEMSESAALLNNLLGAFLIAACVAWIASGLRGTTTGRWLAVAAFTYVTFGLNNQIEAAIFTTLGGTRTMILFFVLPCAFGAAAAVLLFRPRGDTAPIATVLTGGSVATRWWRLIAAWLSFPVIYLLFGMLASPFVVPAYQEQSFGLTLPGFGTIIPVALGRSALYLAVTLPIVTHWSRSRRILTLALATAFFAMMGLVGLISAAFLPPILRVVHGIEILGDAAVYAWVLVALLVPGSQAENTAPVPVAAE